MLCALCLMAHGSFAFQASLRTVPGIKRSHPSAASIRMNLAQPARRQVVTGVLGAAALGVGVRPAAAADARMTIETTAGTMEFEFWPEVAPQTVESFKKLANKGYFDGLAFHRIIPGFVIQGGDPKTRQGYAPDGTLTDGAAQKYGWGTGGPGFNIKAEFNERKHSFGVLSMARSANPDSAGSQFFVCLGDLPSLDNKYTTFGKLVSGQEVLSKLGAAKTARGDTPVQRQGIERVTISE